MKICTYTLRNDTGFAPDPFHGCCTLAACTPNHMGAKLVTDDWIAGFFTDVETPCLVYAMRVEEVMGYDSYYWDSRFQRKKPRMDGLPEDRCGDNIYHLDTSGKWLRDKGPHHQDDRTFEQDTRHAIVYIGSVFAYFGSNAYKNPLPDELRAVLKNGRGIKYTKESEPLFSPFLHWLEALPNGIHGHPRNGEWTGVVHHALTKKSEAENLIQHLLKVKIGFFPLSIPQNDMLRKCPHMIIRWSKELYLFLLMIIRAFLIIDVELR